MTGVRRWLRADGVASVVLGVLGVASAERIGGRLDASTGGVRLVAVLFVLGGIESLLVASLPDRWLATGLRVVAVGSEVAVLGMLAVGLADGWGTADAVMALIAVAVVVISTFELRAAKTLVATTLPTVSPRSSGDRASVS